MCIVYWDVRKRLVVYVQFTGMFVRETSSIRTVYWDVRKRDQ